MISSHRIPPIVILFIGAFNKYSTWERGGSRRTKQQKMTRKGRRAVKIVMPITQILPCTFFCNSVFIRSLFHMIMLQQAAKRAYPREPTSVSEITI